MTLLDLTMGKALQILNCDVYGRESPEQDLS